MNNLNNDGPELLVLNRTVPVQRRPFLESSIPTRVIVGSQRLPQTKEVEKFDRLLAFGDRPAKGGYGPSGSYPSGLSQSATRFDSLLLNSAEEANPHREAREKVKTKSAYHVPIELAIAALNARL